jgi:hypothetical protein
MFNPTEYFRFDSIKVRASLDTYTIYGDDIRLRQGKRGVVLAAGRKHNSYIVEFKIGRSRHGPDVTAVEIDVENLLLERRNRPQRIYL